MCAQLIWVDDESRGVVATRWGKVWRGGSVINYPERSGTLASSRSGVKLSCQCCLSDFPHHTSRRWWCVTAARWSSSPAAAPHLNCNSSAPEHTGPGSVYASTRRVAPEPASPLSTVARGKRSVSPSKKRAPAAEDGARWTFAPIPGAGVDSVFELEGCLCGSAEVKKWKTSGRASSWDEHAAQ